MAQIEPSDGQGHTKTWEELSPREQVRSYHFLRPLLRPLSTSSAPDAGAFYRSLLRPLWRTVERPKPDQQAQPPPTYQNHHTHAIVRCPPRPAGVNQPIRDDPPVRRGDVLKPDRRSPACATERGDLPGLGPADVGRGTGLIGTHSRRS